MKYIIRKHSDKTQHCFLVDRAKHAGMMWSLNVDLAARFDKHGIALAVMKSVRGDEVMYETDAIDLYNKLKKDGIK